MRWFLIVLALAILGFALGSPPRRQLPQAEAEAIAALKALRGEAPPQEPASSWKYSESKDQMRGETIQYAALESETELAFGFPYNGGSRPSLLLRKRRGELAIMLEIERGQFSCNGFGQSTVRAKFGQGAVQKFKCARAADLNGNILFIEPEGKFLQALRKSESMVLEADFFQERPRQMVFRTSRLKW
ncbi:MAG: hypothetical protein WBX25_02260 [Rhodomicrobium sp.]